MDSCWVVRGNLPPQTSDQQSYAPQSSILTTRLHGIRGWAGSAHMESSHRSVHAQSKVNGACVGGWENDMPTSLTAFFNNVVNWQLLGFSASTWTSYRSSRSDNYLPHSNQLTKHCEGREQREHAVEPLATALHSEQEGRRSRGSTGLFLRRLLSVLSGRRSTTFLEPWPRHGEPFTIHFP